MIEFQGPVLSARPAANEALHRVKLLHTAVWGLFAGAILALPVAAWLEHWRLALVLLGLVLAECLVLAANRMRCPLTAVAARYTDDRSENFDIYLPLFVARHNKLIFGSVFGAGLAFTLWRWLGSP